MWEGSHLCFTVFDTEKLRSEIALEGKLNCNKYTQE